MPRATGGHKSASRASKGLQLHAPGFEEPAGGCDHLARPVLVRQAALARPVRDLQADGRVGRYRGQQFAQAELALPRRLKSPSVVVYTAVTSAGPSQS